jgi:hypothetical protein
MDGWMDGWIDGFLADSELLLGTNQFIVIHSYTYVAQPVRRLATLWTTGVWFRSRARILLLLSTASGASQPVGTEGSFDRDTIWLVPDPGTKWNRPMCLPLRSLRIKSFSWIRCPWRQGLRSIAPQVSDSGLFVGLPADSMVFWKAHSSLAREEILHFYGTLRQQPCSHKQNTKRYSETVKSCQ